MLQRLSVLVALACSPALAGPTVVVLDFRGEGVPPAALAGLSEDVRAALAPVASTRGGTVLGQAAMVAPRPDAASCGTPAQCDLAHARALGADLFFVGTSVVVDGAPSLSVQVIGSKSGNVLLGKRVEAKKASELLRTVPGDAALLLEQVFDRYGPPKAGATAAAPAPTPKAPRPSTADDGGADANLHSQAANLFRGAEAVGGRVFVTQRTIRFEAHSVNVQGGAEVIRIADVAGMDRVATLFVNNGVLVRLRTGGEKRFVLEDRERFIQVVSEQMGR